jgi:DNA-binding GntR family transcriptional regulator
MSRADEAYARIKAKIQRCEFQPGARFSEAQLAAELALTKMPVREALSRLIQEGLVRSMPRHGYEVKPITVRDMLDLYQLRLAVEPLAVELAASRIDRPTLGRLSELCEVTCDPSDLASIAEFADAHREFHLLICRACGNRKLSDVLERVLEEFDRLVYMGLLRLDHHATLGTEHKPLVDALERRDSAAAREFAKNSVLETRAEILTAAFDYPEVQLAELRPRPLAAALQAVAG